MSDDGTDASSGTGDPSGRSTSRGQEDGRESGSVQTSTQLALRDASAEPGGGTSEGGSAQRSSPLEYVAPVDPEAFWPRVQQGDAEDSEYTIVYHGQLPTAEQFGARLLDASTEELKEIHLFLRIRRSGGREVYRSRLQAVFDSHPIVAE